jgi:uncharacterized Fe-S cluster protein YjdI
MEKQYTKDDMTVVWKPELCIHSTHCWKSLPRVFNPRQKPWVTLDGAEAVAIKKTVLACPSGALSLLENAAPPPVVEKNDLLPRITPLANGPLQISSGCQVQHKDGTLEVISQTRYLCRCGASNNKPWCDGSHRKIDFRTD